MAPKRSRSRTVNDAPLQHYITPLTDAQLLQSAQARKRRSDGPQPSQSWVKAMSGEEDERKAPHLCRALRGLNPPSVLTPPATKIASKTPAHGDGDDAQTLYTLSSTQYATRGSRYGRDTNVIYSAKYHPMDEVTRPKRAARISGVKQEDLIAEGSATEPDVGDEDAESDDNAQRPLALASTQHALDPRATRHSKREQKPVLYNIKRHPQDYAISGYQHLAGREISQGSSRKSHVQVPKHKVKHSKRRSERIAISRSAGDIEDGESDDQKENQAVAATSAGPVMSPSLRKPLKSLRQGRANQASPTKRPKGRMKPSRPIGRHSTALQPRSSDSRELSQECQSDDSNNITSTFKHGNSSPPPGNEIADAQVTTTMAAQAIQRIPQGDEDWLRSDDANTASGLACAAAATSTPSTPILRALSVHLRTSSTSLRRTTDDTTASREEHPLSSHFEDAFHTDTATTEPEEEPTVSQLERSDEPSSDRSEDATADQNPTKSTHVDPSERADIFSPFASLSQPAVLKSPVSKALVTYSSSVASDSESSVDRIPSNQELFDETVGRHRTVKWLWPFRSSRGSP